MGHRLEITGLVVCPEADRLLDVRSAFVGARSAWQQEGSDVTMSKNTGPRTKHRLQMDCLEQRALLSTAGNGAGASSDASYVVSVYQQLLDRTPSQSDISFWSGVEQRYGANA